MAQNTTNRRTIPSMEPTEKKKYPIYHHPSSSKNHRHPPPPDPSIPSHSTIQSISNNFSKLYTTHKMLSSIKSTDKKLIQQHPHPQPSKNIPISSNLDSSCTTLTKSKSQHHGSRTKTKVVKERILVKVQDFQQVQKKIEDETTQKNWEIKESIEEMGKKQDVKKAESLMSRSYNEGYGDVKMQSFSRRKSFCSSKTELADFFVSSGVKVVAVDMPPFMQIHAVDCARKAHDSLEKFTARTLACTLKREFDGVYGPAWHCIVGTSFGSFVTHSVGGFMYFSMDQKLYILLFKTTVQKAE